ncbi:MAG: peptidoglycan DD-metalloendopeptidase family protein [Endomicrobium sp.]|jgi:septal ring factor EnvC (AmiA/AmiB activator)|nr:peptidoglycan DD-metalloendopeptidase family protein [Endomicrobium sp.]
MKKTFVLIFLLFCSFASASGHLEDVKSQSKKLAEVKKSIKEKEQEKNRLALQERVFKKELKSLNDNIKKAEKKLGKFSADVKTAQHNFENFSKMHKVASSKSAVWNQAVLDEIKLFNKMTFMFSYEQNPSEYKIRRKSLEYKKDNFEKEKKSATISAANAKRWEKSKKYLLILQQKESDITVQHKNMLKEKNELLKTTSGKRFITENEIKALNESARALQDLINKINAGNRKKQTIPVPPQRKNSLPWPVNGKIIVNFGKNKHSELDTYVINNGIKIAAVDFSKVKSIESGTVVFAGQFRSYEKVVIIDHGNSSFSVYGLLDKIFVKKEQKVSKGAVIAELGGGADSVLYFEIRHDNVPDDPLLWLQTK